MPSSTVIWPTEYCIFNFNVAIRWGEESTKVNYKQNNKSHLALINIIKSEQYNHWLAGFEFKCVSQKVFNTYESNCYGINHDFETEMF